MAVNKQIRSGQLFYKSVFVMVLLIFVFISRNIATAQDKANTASQNKIEPAKIVLDSLSFKNDSLSFFQKIIKPIKFRDNRNRREKEQIYELMQRLIQKGELKIDSTTVTQLVNQLDTLSIRNKLNANNIDSVFEVFSINKMASQVVVDSLKIQISAVIQEIANNDLEIKEKQELLNRDNNFLKEIRNIQYLYDAGLDVTDSINEGGIWNRFHKYLKPKTNIIGWHNSWNKTEYLNYNYAYLSAINLYGFELSASGKARNPDDIKEFQKPGGVIEMAARKNCEIHLTVYSKYPNEIAKFLNDNNAQNTLLNELDKLINDNNLKGINIYFDFIKISDSQKFVQFIRELHQNINNIDKNIQLNISIPGIKDEESLTNAGAYNFLDLNALVDYYFVLTDELTSLTNNLALSYSPLYNSDKYGQRTIESTLNFYSNGKIPVWKLIVTLSYLGIEWNVKDFLGSVEYGKGIPLKYSEIVDQYINNQENERTVEGGLDSSQVAAFLNVSYLSTYKKGKIKNTQIWYENESSLSWKYNWILENNLGGVAIRGFGYDDGYSELWDVLGLTMIEIDTVYIHRIFVPEICPCEYDSLEVFSDSLSFKNWKIYWSHFLDYKKENPDSTYLSIFLNDFNLAKIANLRYTNYVSKRNDKSILASKEICLDLISRWHIYASILFGLTLIFSLLAVLLSFWRNQLDRYKLGNNNIQTIILVVFWIFILIALNALLLALFLEPSLNSIGAGNQGESNFWILIKAAGIGAVLGVIFIKSLTKNKYKRKNQP